VPAVAVEAMSTQGNCETHGAAVSATKDAGTGKAGQSSGDRQEENLPKCEQGDRQEQFDEQVLWVPRASLLISSQNAPFQVPL
jgi:hypothetical protein